MKKYNITFSDMPTVVEIKTDDIYSIRFKNQKDEICFIENALNSLHKTSIKFSKFNNKFQTFWKYLKAEFV